jgi:hypothetical protein
MARAWSGLNPSRDKKIPLLEKHLDQLLNSPNPLFNGHWVSFPEGKMVRA